MKRGGASGIARSAGTARLCELPGSQRSHGRTPGRVGRCRIPYEKNSACAGTVKDYAQIHLQTCQNAVCTGQGKNGSRTAAFARLSVYISQGGVREDLSAALVHSAFASVCRAHTIWKRPKSGLVIRQSRPRRRQGLRITAQTACRLDPRCAQDHTRATSRGSDTARRARPCG